ncbi:hypothetical protein CROQUDRAFT_654916 [Cronartium quercuum f. sp. fusiforme G11]|uniref:Uncharacterized protein n=1 Tax=Cronartium quercuum f. sp. fusiforme G11 TaxID=708437 RepID=A0A9P6NQJ2_9BASI|nr:hypothetical protein CROQUDRAFT_654916 [Cronartium quercuum f. sp. fusiforme G11]
MWRIIQDRKPSWFMIEHESSGFEVLEQTFNIITYPRYPMTVIFSLPFYPFWQGE